MRKAVTLIMIGTMILISIVMPAISESSIRYSEDAVKQCCDIWNDYYAQYHLFLDCGYNLSKSDKSVDQLWICYNRDHVAVPSLTDVIPSNASLLTICSVNEQIYGFHIVSESMKSDLEKVIIYTDERVISDISINNSHTEQDTWSVFLTGEDLLSLYALDQFTLKLTVNGENEIIDISYNTTSMEFR